MRQKESETLALGTVPGTRQRDMTTQLCSNLRRPSCTSRECSRATHAHVRGEAALVSFVRSLADLHQTHAQQTRKRELQVARNEMEAMPWQHTWRESWKRIRPTPASSQEKQAGGAHTRPSDARKQPITLSVKSATKKSAMVIGCKMAP